MVHSQLWSGCLYMSRFPSADNVGNHFPPNQALPFDRRKHVNLLASTFVCRGVAGS